MKKIFRTLAIVLCSCSDDFAVHDAGGLEDSVVVVAVDANDPVIDSGSDVLETSVDASDASSVDGNTPIDSGIVDAGPDAPKCPTQGQGCQNIGQRICDDDTHYWYCSGTWTRNDCGQFVPVCMLGADGGLHCVGTPKCVP
jgi:hypothetical protein